MFSFVKIYSSGYLPLSPQRYALQWFSYRSVYVFWFSSNLRRKTFFVLPISFQRWREFCFVDNFTWTFNNYNSLMFLSHGNFPQHIFAVKRHRIHWKSFPSETKIDLVLKNRTTTEWKEVKNFSWAREKMWRFSEEEKWFSSRDHLAHRNEALSFAERKFVVGRTGSWVFRCFLHFLLSPTTRKALHCALDAVDSRAWKG